MRKHLYLIFLFFCFTLFGQNKNDIQLKIVDSVSNEPISYATIRIDGTNQGVIADFDGELRFPSSLFQKNITLLITSIGYQSQKVLVADLKFNIKNVIKLQVQIEALSPIYIKSKRVKSITELEAVVKKLTAEEIVRNAIDSIPVHLDNLAHSHVGYYRDYQTVDNTYYNLNEAIIESFDQGILTKKFEHPKNQIALHFFETNSNFLKDTTLLIPYKSGEKYIQNAKIEANGGNELTILNGHDPIRNYNINTFSYVNIFKKDFLKHHEVKKGDLFYFNNVPIIKIPFIANNKTTGGLHMVNGDIYISLDTYAIYRFNYNCFEAGDTNPIYSINIEYKKQNDKMYLNYITFNNRFAMVDKNTLREEEIVFRLENNEFIVSFNKPIDIKSVRRRCFRIEYKGSKLIVDSVEIIDKNKVLVKVLPFTKDENELSGITSKDMFIKIKRIKDLSGKGIYERQDLQGYQYRELFVQEVFPNTNIPEETVLINRKIPLRDTQINTKLDYKRYWINSPLKSTRTN